MRARTGLWEARVGNHPGPPGHSSGGKVLTPVTPESILNWVAGDAVARNGCAEVPRMQRIPNLDGAKLRWRSFDGHSKCLI